MARTAEQILQGFIGAQAFQIAALQAKLEVSEARVKELEAERAAQAQEMKG